MVSVHSQLLVASKYTALNYHGWQASLFIYMLLLGAAAFMVGELLSFHVVLVMKVGAMLESPTQRC